MGHDKKTPPCSDGKSAGGSENDARLNSYSNITQQNQKSKLQQYFTSEQWDNFVELSAKYEQNGVPRNEADLEALKNVLPSEYENCYKIAVIYANKKGLSGVTAEKYVKTELIEFLEILQDRETEPTLPITPKTTPVYDVLSALEQYAKQGIKLIPCEEIQDSPGRYRPIVSKDKGNEIATSDIEVIKAYQSGANLPHEKIQLFRFTPYEAGLICIDLDKNHSDGADGLVNFDRYLRARGIDPLPYLLRDLKHFPVWVETPRGGIHLYFIAPNEYIEKTRIITDGVEVFYNEPLTAAGSAKEEKAYLLHGNLLNVPELPSEMLQIINDINNETLLCKQTTNQCIKILPSRKSINHCQETEKGK